MGMIKQAIANMIQPSVTAAVAAALKDSELAARVTSLEEKAGEWAAVIAEWRELAGATGVVGDSVTAPAPAAPDTVYDMPELTQ